MASCAPHATLKVSAPLAFDSSLMDFILPRMAIQLCQVFFVIHRDGVMAWMAQEPEIFGLVLTSKRHGSHMVDLPEALAAKADGAEDRRPVHPAPQYGISTKRGPMIGSCRPDVFDDPHIEPT